MKKALIISLVLIEALVVFLGYNAYKSKATVLDDVILKDNSSNMFAIYTETSAGSGTYEVYNNNTFPTMGYVFNSTKSGCVDANDIVIPNALSYSNNKVVVSTKKISHCYLYFDKDNRPASESLIALMDDSNNSGKIEKYTGAVTDECGANSCTTVNNAQNVYIFKSNDINNVIFQNFCWKIIRTTETGGVKLLYNGSPSSGECTKTGANTMLSKTSYSQEWGYNQPAYVGYMYNPNTLNGTYEQQLRGDSTYAVNTNDSLLKEKTEYWYSHSSIDGSKLEDAVYCNDRSLTSNSPVTEANLGTATSGDLYFANYSGPATLECSLVTDSFNTTNIKAKTNYKVGFMTTSEAVLITSAVFSNSNNYWLGSPYIFSSGSASVLTVYYSTPYHYCSASNNTIGVRPVVSVNDTVHITSGEGSTTNPFIAS